MRGLNQHRQQCPFAQDESVPLSGTNALARLNEKRARKRQRLNPPDPPDPPEETPGPSGLSAEVCAFLLNCWAFDQLVL